MAFPTGYTTYPISVINKKILVKPPNNILSLQNKISLLYTYLCFHKKEMIIPPIISIGETIKSHSLLYFCCFSTSMSRLRSIAAFAPITSIKSNPAFVPDPSDPV